ncbi:hypothetical protein [Neisseria uirgultaei]|nr:hypothetical protein [Neisseria uirgultaei]
MPSEQASDGIFYGIRTGLPLFRILENHCRPHLPEFSDKTASAWQCRPAP